MHHEQKMLTSLAVELTPPSIDTSGPYRVASPPPPASQLDRRSFWSLLGQHSSKYVSDQAKKLYQPAYSTWSARSAEFAVGLSLIFIFPGTLLPASVYGFTTTACAIVFSRFMGRLVDEVPKLTIVRLAIIVQKLCASSFYSCLLAAVVLRVDPNSPLAKALLALVVLAGCGHTLSTVCIGVSIERDWATVIADGDSNTLTKLNTSLRRIDLLCKLLAPLFVSLLAAAASYTFALAFLAAFDLAGCAFELYWTQVVYRRLPVLAADQGRKDELKREARRQQAQTPSRPFGPIDALTTTTHLLRQLSYEWQTFARLPIFLSSLAISCLYLTVLSFDNVMLAYFRSHNFTEPFLAGMRGLNVVAGLAGTFVMPLLERRLGLVRAGSWSNMLQVLSLVPVVLGFYLVVPPEGDKGPVWTNVMIFSGLTLSRVGLWSFDLVQTKELQLSLNDRPDRNSLTALQISMQNVADLLKYALTIALSRPSQFRYVALVSFVATCAGAVCYALYVRRERGHLLHLDRLGLNRLLSRKTH